MDSGLLMEVHRRRLCPAIYVGLSCADPSEDSFDFTQNSIFLLSDHKNDVFLLHSVSKQCEFIL